MLGKIILLSKKALPVFLFLLLTFIFFYPFFLKGKVPIALDIPTGMYYPWLNESFGFAVKVPVKNALLTDTISQFWIWRNWAADGLTKGELKIWNPMSMAGYEMSPWFHTVIFSPLNVFYFLTNKVMAMSWIVISQIIISLFSSYFFAKELFKQKTLATYFALVWSFSSFFVGWLTWGTVSHSLASLPLILFFVVYKKRWVGSMYPLYYFLSLCLFLLSGHPQTLAYCLFIWLSFVIVESFKLANSKFIVKNLVILLVAVLFLSPAIIPSLKIIASSIRSLDSQLSSVNYGLVPISKVLGLVLTPNFFGNPATGNYFGGGYNFQEKLVYFGVVPLFLSVFALVNYLYSAKKDRLVLFGLFFVVFGLLVSTENHLGKFIYLFNIPILSTSPAGRGLVILVFGASILSVCGLSSLFNQQNYSKKNFFLSSLIIFFCYLACFTTLGYVFKVFSTSPSSLVESYSDLRQNYTTLLRNLLLSFIIFTFTWLSTLAYSFSKKLKILAFFIIFILTIADSYLFFKKYTPFTPAHLYFPEMPTTKYLTSKLSPTELFRVERQSGEVMPPNMWEPYGLSSLSGYDPMASKAYQSYLLHSNIIPSYSRYIELGQKLDKINDLGVKYFIVIKRNDQGIIDEKGSHPYYIDHSKWQEVLTDGPISILENKDPKQPYKTRSASGQVSLISHTETDYQFKVTTKEATTFIFYQNQNSNWTAKVNGEHVDIVPENETFFGVPVKAGESHVQLSYKNKELDLGFQLSLISLLILVFVIFKSKV